MKRAFLVLGAFLFFAVSVFGQSNTSVAVRDAVGVKSYPAAPRLALQVPVMPAVTLDSVTVVMPDQVAAMQVRNDAGIVPMQDGLGRALADPIFVQLNANAAAAKTGIAPLGRGVVAMTARGIAWSGSVQVTGAQRLRIHLSDVKVPAGTTFWVYGNGPATPFGTEVIDPQGGLWTPIASGDTIHFEVEIPQTATASFRIDNVIELVEPSAAAHSLKPGTNDTPSCLIDVTCVGVNAPSSPLPLTQVDQAIAHLEFVENGSNFVCTGGLINDKPSSSGNPAFLLTANHCISDQATASSLEAFFDYRYANCASTTLPDVNTLPKSVGSTLLVTGAHDAGSSDVTLLRLNSIPSNRILLGWTADPAAVSAGTTLFRVSHPAPSGFGPQPQQYSTQTVTSTGVRCSDVPASRFLYSIPVLGGVYGGSSGSPVMTSSGAIVGQLFGGCAPQGHDPGSGCDTAVLTVDGAFSVSYPLLKPFIDSGSGATPGVCSPSSTTMCLNNNRFAVSASWRTNDGQTGNGTVVKLTDDTGYFWFFSASNVEAVVKVLNACGLGGKYWVFAGGLTNVNVVLTVVDTKTGTVKTYTNPINTAFQPIQDTNAFSTCP
jgi:trypsin-like peptidase